MPNAEFLHRFAVFAEAPNGIAKLRELILQLAVRGKLVPQDPNDEPASVLLGRIREEKERLIAVGKIKKTKISESVDEDSVLFAIPDTWKWVTVKAITHDWGQKVPDSSFHYIDVSSIDNVRGTINTPNVLSADNAPSRARKIIHSGTVLYSTVRPYLLNVVEVNREFVPEAIASTAFAVLHPLPGVIGKFLWYFLRSPDCVERVSELMRGQAYPAINDKDFSIVAIPLPPETEQSRIVAKVDQLMALCDELEAKQNQRAETHGRLIRAAHHPLTQPCDHADFQTAWQRIRDNFDALHTTVDSVKSLRQTILQLAVQGKLVPRDPNDEPASVLLEKIRAEKERLVAEGKIKKGKPLPMINPEEMPFKLPRTWEWAPLGSLLVFGPRNGYSPRPVEYPTDVKTLTLTAVTSGTFDRNQYKFLDIEIDADSHLWLEDGDILIQRANTIEYVGASAIYRGGKRQYIYPDLIMKIRPAQGVDGDFLHMVLHSSVARRHMRERATGTSGSMPKVNQQTVNSIPVPVAPLDQQNKIIAEIRQLMALCDELEAKIQARQTAARQFAEAMVARI